MARRSMILASWLLVGPTASLYPGQVAGQTLSSVTASADRQFRTAVQDVIAHQGGLDQQLEGFGYTEKLRHVENGKLKDVDVYEVAEYKGRKVRRHISHNGKPLEGSDLAKEDKRIESQVRNLEGGKIPPLSNRRVKLEDLLHCSIFANIRQAERDGRPVWLADFHPNRQVKPANINEKFVHNLDGTIGVDPSAFQVVSFEFVLRDSFNIAGGLWFSMKPGTHYSDQEEWLFSSIWLPKLHEFSMRAKAMIGVKLLIDETTTYSDFRKFQVSTMESVTGPNK